MSFLTSLFHRTPQKARPETGTYILRVLQEHAIVIGACGLALLFICVLLFDGFVFYANVLQPISSSLEPATGSQKNIALSESGIIAIRALLDGRQKKFDEILVPFPLTGKTMSSNFAPTPTQTPVPSSKTPRIRH